MATKTDDRDRIDALDLIRGLAILGVFVMNIRDFSMHLRSFDDPLVAGGAVHANVVAWCLGNGLFADKMILILSMLFGAGIVLIHEHAGLRLEDGSRINRRRQMALLAIGLLHAYALWFGDILNTYALGGLLLWPARRAKPVKLFAAGILLYAVAAVFRQWPMLYRDGIRSWLFDSWSFGLGYGRAKPPMTWTAAYHGTWLELAHWRAWLNWYWHVEGFVSFNGWRCLGAMLIGMGFMKAGVLSDHPRPTVVRRLIVAGYGLGVPLVLLGMNESLAGHAVLGPRFGLRSVTSYENLATIVGSLLMALGHLGLFLVWNRKSRGSAFAGRIRAVGRMALTCYLLQTVASVLVFDPWALAQWGEWSFVRQLGFVVAVNTVLLAAAPIYLRRFGQGPIERLWRGFYRPRRAESVGAISEPSPRS